MATESKRAQKGIKNSKEGRLPHGGRWHKVARGATSIGGGGGEGQGHWDKRILGC